jgi:chromosome segregation ATPase
VEKDGAIMNETESRSWRSDINRSLIAIHRGQASNTATLEAIEKKVDETKKSIEAVTEKQSKHGERLASLETKAGYIGAAAGATVGGAIALGKWFFTKQ